MIKSIVALARLQYVLNSNAKDSKADSTDVVDKQFLDELSHYCTFSHAAYGWKGSLLGGRLPLGWNSNRNLAKSLGIDEQDVIFVDWHPKVFQPVSQMHEYDDTFMLHCAF